MIKRLLLAIILLTQASGIIGAQPQKIDRAVVNLPQGPLTRVPSPNRRWNLIFECPNNCSARRLWIEQTSTHARRLVKEFERSLSISWAPNGRSFFVNDASGSTDTLCYVYDPATLKETDMASLIVAAFPGAAQYLKAGHVYLEAKRWINSREIFVALRGHFDGQPPPGALEAFGIEYSVDLNSGRVCEASRRASE